MPNKLHPPKKTSVPLWLCGKKNSGFTLIEIVCVLFILGGIFIFLGQQAPKYTHNLRPKHLTTLTQGLVTQAQSLAITQPQAEGCAETPTHTYIYLTQGDHPQLSILYGDPSTTARTPHGNQLNFPKHVKALSGSQTFQNSLEQPLLVWEFDTEGKCITPENTLTLNIHNQKSVTLKVSEWGVLSQAG